MKVLMWVFIFLCIAFDVKAQSNQDLRKTRPASKEKRAQSSCTRLYTPVARAFPPRISSFFVSPAHFFQTHRLLFFFASTCPYCQQEAPVLKRWIESHGARVQAYSLNGESLPDFPETRIPNEDLIQTVFQHHAIRYPALFILNVDTSAIYPVAIGALNAMELDERLQHLFSKIVAYEERSVS